MKKLLWLALCLGALAGRARAQAAPSNLVVVRILDRGTSADVFITRGPEQTEKVEINTGLAGFDKSMTLVSEGFYAILQRLYQQGYALQATTGVPASPATGVITLLFVKAG